MTKAVFFLVCVVLIVLGKGLVKVKVKLLTHMSSLDNSSPVQIGLISLVPSQASYVDLSYCVYLSVYLK